MRKVGKSVLSKFTLHVNNKFSYRRDKSFCESIVMRRTVSSRTERPELESSKTEQKLVGKTSCSSDK